MELSIKKEIEEVSSNSINQYLLMFYNVYNDKSINKADRLKMMRKLKNNITVTLEAMEDHIIETK